jgi:serine/threonine-protein kinase
MALAHVQKEPVRPSEKTELPVPACLEEVIMQCLAKKPEDRPVSASAVARMLDACTEVEHWTQDQAHQWWVSHMPENLAGAPTLPSDGLRTSVDVG